MDDHLSSCGRILHSLCGGCYICMGSMDLLRAYTNNTNMTVSIMLAVRAKMNFVPINFFFILSQFLLKMNISLEILIFHTQTCRS